MCHAWRDIKSCSGPRLHFIGLADLPIKTDCPSISAVLSICPPFVSKVFCTCCRFVSHLCLTCLVWLVFNLSPLLFHVCATFLFASYLRPAHLFATCSPDPFSFVFACLPPVSCMHPSSFPIGSHLLSTCLPVVSNCFTVYTFVFQIWICLPLSSQNLPTFCVFHLSPICLRLFFHLSHFSQFFPHLSPTLLLPIISQFFQFPSSFVSVRICSPLIWNIYNLHCCWVAKLGSCLGSWLVSYLFPWGSGMEDSGFVSPLSPLAFHLLLISFSRIVLFAWFPCCWCPWAEDFGFRYLTCFPFPNPCGMVWDMTSICLSSAGFVGGDSGFDLCRVFLPFVELHVFAFVSLLLSDSFAFHVGGFLDRGFWVCFLTRSTLAPYSFPHSLSLRTLCCPCIAGVSHLICAGLPTCLHDLAGFSKKMFHKGLELPRSSGTTCSAAGTFCPQACGYQNPELKWTWSKTEINREHESNICEQRCRYSWSPPTMQRTWWSCRSVLFISALPTRFNRTCALDDSLCFDG